MALIHLNATVGTTATLIFSVPSGGLPQSVACQVQNLDTASIWIGDASIATSGATRGHLVAANGNFQLWLSPGDKLYGISAAGTTAGAVSVLYSGK
jgi:hypothetical protein